MMQSNTRCRYALRVVRSITTTEARLFQHQFFQVGSTIFLVASSTWVALPTVKTVETVGGFGACECG